MDWLEELEICLVDNFNESQSEKESKESNEEETKMDYTNLDGTDNQFCNLLKDARNGSIFSLKQIADLEIHSPPPE